MVITYLQKTLALNCLFAKVGVFLALCFTQCGQTIIGLTILSPFLIAHSPDLSSILVYQQNGRYFLELKSSIVAFEGEVNFHFGKDSYKTPEEFNELAIKHFKRSCVVVVNRDTIKYINPQIQLGHETTLLVELENMPQKVNHFYIRNVFFKDMPNNQSDFFFSYDSLQINRYVMNDKNNHEVNIKIESNISLVEDDSKPLNLPLAYIFIILLVFSITSFIIYIRYRKVKKQYNND